VCSMLAASIVTPHECVLPAGLLCAGCLCVLLRFAMLLVCCLMQPFWPQAGNCRRSCRPAGCTVRLQHYVATAQPITVVVCYLSQWSHLPAKNGTATVACWVNRKPVL
jgi:hypothetical protein